MAFRSSTNLLKKVDFPTLGLPTIATIFDMFLYLLVVTKSSQFIFIFPPVVLYLDVSLQKNLFAKETFQFFPCLDAYPFQRFTSLTDQDAFLAVPFHIDFRTDAYDFCFFIKINNGYFCAVGNFFFIVVEDFFPNDFGSEEALRLVGKFFLVIKRSMEG